MKNLNKNKGEKRQQEKMKNEKFPDTSVIKLKYTSRHFRRKLLNELKDIIQNKNKQ